MPFFKKKKTDAEPSENISTIEIHAENVEASDSVGTMEDVQAMMEKYDRESNTRIYEGVPAKVMRWFLVAFSLFSVYMNLIAMWDERTRRASLWGCSPGLYILQGSRAGRKGASTTSRGTTALWVF